MKQIIDQSQKRVKADFIIQHAQIADAKLLRFQSQVNLKRNR